MAEQQPEPLAELASLYRKASIGASARPLTPRPLPPRRSPLDPRTVTMPGHRRWPGLLTAGRAALFNEAAAGAHPWPLVLHGPAGTGKTSFALLLHDYASGLFFRLPGLLKLVNDAKYGRARRADLYPETDHPEQDLPEARLWDEVGNAAKNPLVVVDEIGTRDQVTAAHYEALLELLVRREHTPHVVISNLDFETELGQVYGDRVLSRLGAGTVKKFEGPDLRLAGRKP